MNNLDRRSSAEKAFAKARGWRVARRHASLSEIAAGRRNAQREEHAYDQIKGMYDHATEYDFVGTTRPAALIVHPYRHYTQAEVSAVAQRYGLLGQVVKPTLYPNVDAQTIVFCRPEGLLG